MSQQRTLRRRKSRMIYLDRAHLLSMSPRVVEERARRHYRGWSGTVTTYTQSDIASAAEFDFGPVRVGGGKTALNRIGTS